MKQYVLGFAFDDDRCNHVLLVEKRHGPAINIGKWNGIGGHVEPGEDMLTAMCREFMEEASGTACWNELGRFTGNGWEIGLFHGVFQEGCHPAFNDADEPLEFKEIESVLDPTNRGRYAQNVQTMVAHAVMGEGTIELHVTN